MQAQTTVRNEHEERNTRQLVVLWRACGDSDHDIQGELLMRGYTEEEASRLMAADWQSPETDTEVRVSQLLLQQVVIIAAGLREQITAQTRIINELCSEVKELRGQIVTPIGVKANRSGMFPNN